MKDWVSVLVPCYNGEKFLDSCFNNLLKQLYDKIELVFIDDGSKDKSKENMEKLDKTFSEPILVYSMISQAQDKKNNNENTGQDMSEYMKEIDMDSLDNQAKMDLAAVQNGTMTQEQFMAAHFDLIRDTVRDKMGSAIDSMGDSLVQSSAISFVKKEYKKSE